MARKIIGLLRHRVVFQTRVLTPDTQGGYSEAWSTYATTWASIEPIQYKEVYNSEQLRHHVDHKVIIRDLTGLTSTMRMTFNNRTFQIKSIKRELETSWHMVLICAEGVAA